MNILNWFYISVFHRRIGEGFKYKYKLDMKKIKYYI